MLGVDRSAAAAIAAQPDLCVVVRQAAMLLPRLTELVHRCRTEPDPGAELARSCGALASAWTRLSEQVQQAGPSAATLHLEQLLRVQQRITVEASQLAFREHTPRWERVAAAFGDGLTDAADELLLLAAELWPR
jgi:hypothetical protein